MQSRLKASLCFLPPGVCRLQCDMPSSLRALAWAPRQECSWLDLPDVGRHCWQRWGDAGIWLNWFVCTELFRSGSEVRSVHVQTWCHVTMMSPMCHLCVIYITCVSPVSSVSLVCHLCSTCVSSVTCVTPVFHLCVICDRLHCSVQPDH